MRDPQSLRRPSRFTGDDEFVAVGQKIFFEDPPETSRRSGEPLIIRRGSRVAKVRRHDAATAAVYHLCFIAKVIPQARGARPALGRCAHRRYSITRVTCGKPPSLTHIKQGLLIRLLINVVCELYRGKRVEFCFPPLCCSQIWTD